jgi:hypothetical protein
LLGDVAIPIINYLLITNVTTNFLAPVDAPSVIISIVPSSNNSLAAVGSAVSTVPAAEPECATVMPPPVTAVPPISKDIPALAPEIAPCKAVIILIIFPLSGTGTKVDDAVLMSAIVEVKN